MAIGKQGRGAPALRPGRPLDEQERSGEHRAQWGGKDVPEPDPLAQRGCRVVRCDREDGGRERENRSSAAMTEREIFLEALEMDTPEARATYLHGACAGNVTLRLKVEELL